MLTGAFDVEFCVESSRKQKIFPVLTGVFSCADGRFFLCWRAFKDSRLRCICAVSLQYEYLEQQQTTTTTHISAGNHFITFRLFCSLRLTVNFLLFLMLSALLLWLFGIQNIISDVILLYSRRFCRRSFRFFQMLRVLLLFVIVVAETNFRLGLFWMGFEISRRYILIFKLDMPCAVSRA